MDGHLNRLDEDFVGTLSVSCRPDRDFFFATFSGFTNPGIVKKYTFAQKDTPRDPEKDTWQVFRRTHLKGINPEEFITEQAWYTSDDETKIPMFIVRYKDTKRDGTAPAIQYGAYSPFVGSWLINHFRIGYGGFSHTINPFFSPGMLTWIKAYHGIIAVPGIRGGAEFGEEWHLAGIRENRVKVFEDFIAAANFLMDNDYAGRGKVVINGGSNGGTLVAASINRSPLETFGAAIAEVGVMDLLKARMAYCLMLRRL